MLHSHLPYVLNHGRWPHGSDWICEAAIDTYLPLVAKLRAMDEGNIAAPITIGFTPVLANQLEHPTFVAELESYFAQRLESCAEADVAMRESGDESLLHLVTFWATRLRRLYALWHDIGHDILGEFRRLEEKERLEITSSAATHGFLPLLGRDESIRLQLAVGRAEHVRIFGREPSGCWVPECGYRPRGMWSPLPDAPGSGERCGIDEHLAGAGYRYFYVDSHMANAGAPLGIYGELFDGEAEHVASEWPTDRESPTQASQSPYRSYRVSSTRSPIDVAALVRDPRSSMQVWSRGSGYPGDGAYLEFHKIRWPGGLRLWRVTSRTSDLGDKKSYDPAVARLTAREHAAHFAALLAEVAATEASGSDGVIVDPFDTELFGHWWFEGPDFIGDLYEALPDHPRVRAVTATEHLDGHAAHVGIRLTQGSWGRNGDFSMWMNDQVAWTWRIIWELEHTFWNIAPAALDRPDLHDILAQAARSLLLLQSSDWQFIISTGEASDYAIHRFNGHAAETRELLGALAGGLAGGDAGVGHAMAAALQQRDDVFRDILSGVRWALTHGWGEMAEEREVDL